MPGKMILAGYDQYGKVPEIVSVKPSHTSTGVKWSVDRAGVYETKKEAVEVAKEIAREDRLPGVNIWKSVNGESEFQRSWVNTVDFRKEDISFLSG
jgi:hypothetical protein